MLVNINWLRDWVEFDYDLEQLATYLTMGGLEVESIEPLFQVDERIVVGQVIKFEPHPERDNLLVCLVDAGANSENLQIVCGASNISIDGKYPVARIGSSISDKKIEKCFIRSVESAGMLCSSSELGLHGTNDELLRLSDSASVGQSLNSYLQLDDNVINLELTPNRADCLSVRGVAREVALLSNSKFRNHSISEIPSKLATNFKISVNHFKDCPRFCGRLIQGIQPDAITPDWMRERIHRVGLRCVHPIVDITNYVMMELGQPMHAFDAKVFKQSHILVRRSQKGESLRLLDGDTLELMDDNLLITDGTEPVALAGVMGGEKSGIHPNTEDLFLEAAYFTPEAIRRTSSKFGLHTDASHRFERGVDPTGQAVAIHRATELILQIAGGEPGPLQEVKSDEHLPVKNECRVRKDRVNRVLGTDMSTEQIETILKAVNKVVETENDGWRVIPHIYRFDIDEEHDQIEEIARIYGYDSIPSRMNFKPAFKSLLSESEVQEASIRNALYYRGYHEAVTYSFVDPELQNKIKPSIKATELSNPIASNLSVMRTSLWTGLVEALLENHRRGKNIIRLFEIGRVFKLEQEVNVIAGISYGSLAPLQWASPQQTTDFYDIKADLEQLLELTGRNDDFEIRSQQCEGLHPGCSATIFLDNECFGEIGQLHPTLLDALGFDSQVYVFELEMNALSNRVLNHYNTISRYPAVTRDLSFVTPENLPYTTLTKLIKEYADKSLQNLTLFDVYYDESSGKSQKHLAYRLTYRLPSRTLTYAEVSDNINKIIEMAHKQLNVQLRD